MGWRSGEHGFRNEDVVGGDVSVENVIDNRSSVLSSVFDAELDGMGWLAWKWRRVPCQFPSDASIWRSIVPATLLLLATCLVLRLVSTAEGLLNRDLTIECRPINCSMV